MTTLTHKDKRDLNHRARAHGLPDLWPEEEELAKRLHHQMRESYERALYAGLTGQTSGWPGLPFFAVDPASKTPSHQGAWAWPSSASALGMQNSYHNLSYVDLGQPAGPEKRSPLEWLTRILFG